MGIDSGCSSHDRGDKAWRMHGVQVGRVVAVRTGTRQWDCFRIIPSLGYWDEHLSPGWLTRPNNGGFAVCGVPSIHGAFYPVSHWVGLICLPCLHKGTRNAFLPQCFLVLLPCEGWLALPTKLECTQHRYT
jgi:hypothetical protein